LEYLLKSSLLLKETLAGCLKIKYDGIAAAEIAIERPIKTLFFFMF
jgi:hypothetical protein